MIKHGVKRDKVVTGTGELGEEERSELGGESRMSRQSQKMSPPISLISGGYCQRVGAPAAAADEAWLCLHCGNAIRYKIVFLSI